MSGSSLIYKAGPAPFRSFRSEMHGRLCRMYGMRLGAFSGLHGSWAVRKDPSRVRGPAQAPERRPSVVPGGQLALRVIQMLVQTLPHRSLLGILFGLSAIIEN